MSLSSPPPPPGPACVCARGPIPRDAAGNTWREQRVRDCPVHGEDGTAPWPGDHRLLPTRAEAVAAWPR